MSTPDYTFEDVVEEVKEEGLDQWGGYGPYVQAAIQLGYLDDALRDIARDCRDRYFKLNPEAKNGHGSVPSGTVLPGTHYMAPDQLNGVKLLGAEGYLVRPLPPGADIPSGGYFTFRGRRYAKNDFVGEFFRIRGRWPRAGEHLHAQGLIAQIVRVGKVNLSYILVEEPPPIVPLDIKKQWGKETYQTKLEWMSWMFLAQS